jgi:hypothetical protein
MVNINDYVQGLLVEHLGFDDVNLKKYEEIIRLGFDKMKDDFMKLLIDVKYLKDSKNIEYPVAYFITALKNQLTKRNIKY